VADDIIAAMNLSTLGEFGLIELIRKCVIPTYQSHTMTSSRVVLGVGDDTAAWRTGHLLELGTTDTLVQDVHFRFSWCTWADLGYKSLAVNLSDIAAMGGVPRYALVSLSCPETVEADDVLQYYDAMVRLAGLHDVAIVGGNLTSSPVVVSTVTLLGEVEPERMLRRDAARSGDLIAVTGRLGAAASALSCLDQEVATSDSVHPELLESLLRPLPRVVEARLASEHGIRCAIDVSDGLLGDLGHICEASNLSATVEATKVPATGWPAGDEARQTALALSGGEDYELLFTGAPECVIEVASILPCRVTVVGEMRHSAGTPSVEVVDPSGHPRDVGSLGWRHFSP
jgi:thiamine-monophosphate kinase